MSRFLSFVVFLAGLAVVAWVAFGYLGSNPLALTIILLIAGFYVAGGLELRRFQGATASLARAAGELESVPRSLAAFLDRLHPSLRNAVRLRVEGGRVALPGPALTPYLAGLLVLLGMLGTFLGMVATLRGTGVALENATDIAAIRASLAAPVSGLGFAFGTSVAGVAASAALGLLAALCRRERLQAGQLLDTRIATTLRPYSLAHQREEFYQLLRRQADLMPALLDRLEAMTEALARQHEALGERLSVGQERFHEKVDAEYRRLAASVEACVKESLEEGARRAGAAIQPAVETAMSGLAREAAELREAVAQAVQRQLDTLSERVEAGTTAVTQAWRAALDEHRLAGQALAGELGSTLAGFASSFEQRSTELVHDISARLERMTAAVSERWGASLAGHERASAALAGEIGASFDRFAQGYERRASELLEGLAGRLDATAATVSTAWNEALQEHRRTGEALAGAVQASLDGFAEHFERRAAGLVDGVAGQLDAAAQRLAAAWDGALERHQQASGKLLDETGQVLSAAAGAFERHAAGLLESVGQAHQTLRTELASRDEARQAAWAQALENLSGTLQRELLETGEKITFRQQEVCEALAQAAGQVSAETQAAARATIAEIERLVQAASEAPRAAAEVIGELRQKLSDSMERDNAMLEERERLLQTVAGLLDTVNHASTEQRAAVDALVGASAEMLERVGARFTEQVASETGRLESVAAQVTGSAAEVASLGESLDHAVKLFSESTDKLMHHLQRIEEALGQAMARSDEQLAYYVAQAKDVIELSMMSQKQIVEELRLLDAQRTPAGDAS